MKNSKSNREEKMSEIQERLMKGTKEIYESGKWAEYISVMSKFPNYSINNCILIASQCPHASYVCGYKKWNEFNRNVVKGESGIMIFQRPMKCLKHPLLIVNQGDYLMNRGSKQDNE